MAQGTPLSEEQLRELNEIAQLPVEQQKERLPLFLKTLTPEQVEFLRKQQQNGGCPFCSIAEGKLESMKVYEDSNFLAVLDIKPANKGHILLFPKKHYQLLGQMSDQEIGQLFTLANRLSRVVFEEMKAEGTNIFVANGTVAGQMVNHVGVHIIPRWKGDKVAFSWEGTKVDMNDMKAIQQTLVQGAQALAQPPAQEALREEPVEIEDEDSSDEEERIP